MNPKYQARREEAEAKIKQTHPKARYSPHLSHYRFPADKKLWPSWAFQLVEAKYSENEGTAYSTRNVNMGHGEANRFDRWGHPPAKPAEPTHTVRVVSADTVALFRAQRGFTTRQLETLRAAYRAQHAKTWTELLIAERKRLEKNARSRAYKSAKRVAK